MKWSRYNLLFRSKKYGWLLYNSLSNSFANLDDDTYTVVEEIRKMNGGYDVSKNPGLALQLIQIKALISEEEEELALQKIGLRRDLESYNTNSLSLTIAPTTACNFACTYCYQDCGKAGKMTRGTEKNLLDFVGRFQTASYITNSWFGGEPLLMFDSIERITEGILKLDKPYTASMVTNGYLLDHYKIGKLKELKIRSLQITIDGLEEGHNKRRILKNGGPTYQVILENIKSLMESWDGLLKIRVNIDKKNSSLFPDIMARLREELPVSKERLSIYAGIVQDNKGSNPDISCQIDREEVADFEVEMYRKHGITLNKFYPDPNKFGCAATRANSFVVGPKGEIYLCWHNLGVENMVIGSVYDGKITNMDIPAKYMVGANAFEDKDCLNCFYLPVCDGGCAHLRQLNIYEGEDHDTCLRYKDRLPDYLEIYYEQKLDSNK